MSDNANYISAEQFLSLDEKIQDIFRNWAERNFKEWDLVYDLNHKEVNQIDTVLDTTKSSINVGRVFYLDRDIFWTSMFEPDAIPLFRLSHLWEFVEEMTQEYIVVDFMADEYLIKTTCTDEILGWKESKLESFWESAILVAKSKASTTESV